MVHAFLLRPLHIPRPNILSIVDLITDIVEIMYIQIYEDTNLFYI
jgi:hypothetical protein